MRIAAAALALLIAGCPEVPPPKIPPPGPPEPEPAPAPAEPRAAVTAHPEDAPPPPTPAPLVPRLEVVEASGGNAEYARAVFAPTAQIMKECKPGGGGAITVRVQSHDGSTKMDVDPRSGLDAATRRCVLEALSTVDLEVPSQRSPSDRPSGFSSVVTVKW